MANDNLKYYEMGRAVPKDAQKAFNNGSFSGTDINPMWRIKKLTEMFGPAGIGWYTEILSERYEEHFDTTMAIVDINLYVKVDGEWSKPIYGTGGNALVKSTKSGQRSSDEGYKMAYTDALSVACKALGIGADIYYEKDRTKYTANEETPAPAKAAPAKKSEAKTEEKVDVVLTPMRERIKSIYRGAILDELLNKYNVLTVADLSKEQLETILKNYDEWQAKKKEARTA